MSLAEGQLTVPINASHFLISCVMGYVKQIYIWPGGQKHQTKGCLAFLFSFLQVIINNIK